MGAGKVDELQNEKRNKQKYDEGYIKNIIFPLNYHIE